MEKRFVLFIVLTMVIVVGYNALVAKFGPKRPDVAGGKAGPARPGDREPAAAAEGKSAEGKSAEGKEAEGKASEGKSAEGLPAEQPASGDRAADSSTAERGDSGTGEGTRLHPHRLVTLGSYEAGAASPLLVTLNSRGATLERVELVGRSGGGELTYRDLDNPAGYLGSLALTPEVPSGCRIRVIPPGTPAAAANPADASWGTGLKVGDLLLAVNGRTVANAGDFEAALAGTRPGDTVKLTVEREVEQQARTSEFTAVLAVRPFELIRPEPLDRGAVRTHPLSLRASIRNEAPSQGPFLDALNGEDWEVRTKDEDPSAVEFRFVMDAGRAASLGLPGPVEVLKQFRLGSPAGESGAAGGVGQYHLQFAIELRNLGTQPQKLSYRLDGTNGLPVEGWWYSAKIHPGMFQSAGARDVVLSTVQGGGRLVGCPAIVSRAAKEERYPETALFGEGEPSPARAVQYIGVDTQYFASALIPAGEKPGEAAVFARAEAMVLNDVTRIPKGWERTANVTYQLTSTPVELAPDQSHRQEFVLFAGPKEPEVLTQYRLNDLIYYGWFGAVSRLLSTILHFFHDRLVGNYALAIIMLTVLVRGCMFPLSRKAAKNAAMMQELAPEMKKIAEKYKNNMEARGKAQQELFRKHNYNPLSGCWMMFLQLPVFIGLYRCLAVDIKLRQAPLFPGVEWASNLAGPDKLFHWKSSFFGFLTDESGWLGPYFNLLPIFTIGLFLVHQKLFTPPATDEQTAMQMKMMKVMTIFMGVLFYKVPAGLCIYFIASSLWGIAERKLLPKSTVGKPAETNGEGGGALGLFAKPFAPKEDGNGTLPRKRPSRRPKPKP